MSTSLIEEDRCSISVKYQEFYVVGQPYTFYTSLDQIHNSKQAKILQ